MCTDLSKMSTLGHKYLQNLIVPKHIPTVQVRDSYYVWLAVKEVNYTCRCFAVYSSIMPYINHVTACGRMPPMNITLYEHVG